MITRQFKVFEKTTREVADTTPSCVVQLREQPAVPPIDDPQNSYIGGNAVLTLEVTVAEAEQFVVGGLVALALTPQV